MRYFFNIHLEGESMRKRAANADQKPNTKTKKN